MGKKGIPEGGKVSIDYMDGMMTVLYAVAELTLKERIPYRYVTKEGDEIKEQIIMIDAGGYMFHNVMEKLKKEFNFGDTCQQFTKEYVEAFRYRLDVRIQELVMHSEKDREEVLRLVRGLIGYRERDDF